MRIIAITLKYEQLFIFLGYTQFSNILMEKVKEIESASSLRLIAYENLALYFGCTFLLEQFKGLPKILLHLILQPTIREQVNIN